MKSQFLREILKKRDLSLVVAIRKSNGTLTHPWRILLLLQAEVESDSSEDEEDTADCATVGGGIGGQSNPGNKSRRKPERKKKR